MMLNALSGVAVSMSATDVAKLTSNTSTSARAQNNTHPRPLRRPNNYHSAYVRVFTHTHTHTHKKPNYVSHAIVKSKTSLHSLERIHIIKCVGELLYVAMHDLPSCMSKATLKFDVHACACVRACGMRNELATN